jgi:proprotein convertase subtilisin/kexin type 5
MPYNQTNTTNCLNSCPIGNYEDSFNRICSLCATNCLNCSSTNNCYNCTNNTYLYMNNCFSNCPNGYYLGANICIACSNNCLVCISSTNCTICSSNYSLYSNKCYSSCPSTTYLSTNLLNNANICVNCQINCLICQSYYSCINCSNGYVLQSGSCKSSCQAYYYLSKNQCL